MADTFSETHKRLLVGRANTIFERLADRDAFESSGRTDAKVSDILDEWIDLYPDREMFEHRLRRDGLTIADAREGIRSEKLAASEPIPEWVDHLEDLIATVNDCHIDNVGTQPEVAGTRAASDETTPFAEVVNAVTIHAYRRIATEPVITVLTEDALTSTLDWFQRRFRRRFKRIFFVEFKSFVSAHDGDLAGASPEAFANSEDLPDEYYRQFVRYLLNGGFADLCEEYPMFARLVTTQIRQLRDYLRQFCWRIESDRLALTETFGSGEPIGTVVDLDILADDTHGDGQAVMRVTFESGCSLVYKPRSVKAGDRFYRLLDDLNDHLPVPDFQTPTYLCRDKYGWMEWIPATDPDDKAALDRYYRRAGGLCCLTYFLEFTDCQVENVLVAGEQPIIVDAETVLHPYIAPDRYLGGEIETTDAFMNSVLLSLLLPFSSIGRDHDHENDLSVKAAGFAVTDEPATISDVHLPKIAAANSDVMVVKNETATLERDENIPVLDGDPQPPSKHIDAFLDGFEATYRRLLAMREDSLLIDELDVFGRFTGVVNRMVFRPTRQYMAIITALSARECLHDGVQFSLTLEQLAVPFFEDQYVDDESWQMYEAEREALRLLDPPRFTSATNNLSIRKDGEPVGLNATHSGIERAQQRLAEASLADMEEQVELIRGCFGEIPSPQPDVNPDTDSGIPTDEDLRREAVDIVDGIHDAGLESKGTFACASLAGWLESDRLALRALDESLQAGRAGIGIVGAALYRLTGDRRYRRVALNTVRPFRDAIKSDALPSRMCTTGGTRGAGSVAYGLGLVGDLLNDEDIVEEAARVGEFLTPAIIEDDDRYDVVRGSAGTILGLLGVYERRREPTLLAAAKQCGDHLLDRHDYTDGGIPCWQTIDGQPPLTGFAHGVAGIAFALIRLSDATGDPTYRRVAIAALELEADTYVSAANNWRDLRIEANGGFANRWCHGRSGIGLARIGMSDYANQQLIDQGIERALAGATTDTEDQLDHLCCGDAGRAMFLLEAERWDDGHNNDARELLGKILERKETTGSYRTKSRTDRFQKPTFLDGATGIAYAMLRVTAPETLPCVLRFE